ncbi:uncharacterized protein JCM6883_005714 [Sporobolomyces salmoneus]|uniref:uncharacterized protein n=1 Tax=Sporobolomyces salmoneus TaxID=183962 RepID=UPI00317FA88C
MHLTPTAKRPKRTLTLPEPLSLEGSLSEEILLRCLSFLTVQDLVTVSRVSSAWYRLSQDPQLWRSLYLRTYASASTRRQASLGVTVKRSSRPWKELYKISTNWRNGTAKSSTTVLTNTVRKAVLAPTIPTDMTLPDQLSSFPQEAVKEEEETFDTLLQIHQQYFFSASKSQPCSDPATEPPSITVSQSLPNGSSQFLSTFSSPRLASFYSLRPDFRPPLSITEIKLDESSTNSGRLHLAIFYSTGQFSIFRIDFTSTLFSATEVYCSLALNSNAAFSSSSPFDFVSTAKFHFPLFVTCSNSFTLRFYQLSYSPSSSDQLVVRESETPLQSRERWAPVVLSLERIRGKSRQEGSKEFKVSLAYSLPVFPNDWTVGLQEFSLVLFPSLSKPIEITTVQAISHLTHHQSLSPATRYSSAFSSSPVARNRISPVTSIEYSSPFIVTSRTDNTIEVYRVTSHYLKPRLAPKSGSGEKKLEIRHEKTLFGHTARVGSVALVQGEGSGVEDGEGRSSRKKLVSAGDDGTFKVWSLSSSVRKRGRDDEEVIDIQTMVTTQGEGEQAGTEWQRMKRRRMEKRTTEDSREEDEGNRRRPERIRKILVDQDKIVVLGSTSATTDGSPGGHGGGERMRVLRFD